MACTAFFLVIAYFYFPLVLASLAIVAKLIPCSETKQRTLEDIAAAFGDKVVFVTDRIVVDEQAILEDKAGHGHVEAT